MSYDIERKVLANFAQSQSFFGLSPFGIDGEPFAPANDSGFMTVLNGIGRISSTGSPGANLHDYAGVLAITILTDGKVGAVGATPFIDTVIAAFTNLKIDEDGNTPDAASLVVIDFGRDGFVPYVANKAQETPYLRTVINCPFIRTERK